MKRLRARLLSAALLSLPVLAILPARAASADDLVKDVRGAVQELRDDGKHPSYRVLFAAASPSIAPGALVARVKQVALGPFVDTGLLTAFSPEIDSDPKTGPAIVINVKFDILSHPGTYDVDLEIGLKDQAAAPGQRLTVQLTRPAAQLRAPPSLLFDITAHVFGVEEIEPSTFTLAEASERSALNALSLEQLDRATHGNEEISARLSFGPPQQIAARETLNPTAVPAGTFPIGVSKGRIEARAPQLASPVVFNYEVRRRRPAYWIPIIVLLAGLAGWISRVYLKRREERLGLEAKLEDLVAELDRQAESWTNEGQKAQMNALKKEIPRALSSSDDAALSSAVKQAEALIAAIVAKRGEKQQALIDETNQASATLDLPWTLPLRVDLGPLKKLFSEAQPLALAGDLSAAEETLREARKKVAKVPAAGARWARELRQVLAELGSSAEPLPTTGAEALKKGSEAVDAALEAITALDPVKPALDPLLRALHKAESATANLAGQLVDALDATARQVAGLLGAFEDDDLAAQAGALRAAARVTEGADAKATLARANEARVRFARAIAAAIEALKKHLDSTDPAPALVAPLIAQGQYTEAMRTIATAAKLPRRHAIARVDGKEPEVRDEAASRARRAAADPEPARALDIRLRGEARAPLSIPQLSSMQKLLLAKVARGVFSACAVAFGAWVVYADDFYGTAKEIAGLIAIGFSMDFTVESALSAFEKPKRT